MVIFFDEDGVMQTGRADEEPPTEAETEEETEYEERRGRPRLFSLPDTDNAFNLKMKKFH